VQGAGYSVQGPGSRYRVQGAGTVYSEMGQGPECRVHGTVYSVQGAGCRVQGTGCRVQGTGYRALYSVFGGCLWWLFTRILKAYWIHENPRAH